MAKVYGLFGAMTGKLADVVMVVRNGAQVARKYQPIVTNPSTQAQVAVRSRLKLMSQIGQVMGPVIAIPREGTVSARNLFIKQNFPLSTYSDNKATIDLNKIQLTRSVVGLPPVYLTRATNGITATLTTTGYGPYTASRVVYVMFAKGTNQKLRFVTSSVVSEAGESGGFITQLPAVTSEVVVYAYAVRDNTDAARAAFGNMVTPSAEQVASLLVSRVLTESDVTLSETRGDTLEAAN